MNARISYPSPSQPCHTESNRTRGGGYHHLGDGDLAALKFLGFGDHNAEDSILHRSVDLVLVDANRETEGATELADAALRNPVFGSRLLGSVLGGGDFSASLIFTFGGAIFVFDGRLMGLFSIGLAAFGDSTCSCGTFDKAGVGSARGIGAFRAAADCQGLSVGELDLDIFLLDTREFAVEFIGIFNLLDIELGVECLQGAAPVVMGIAVAAVLIEVVEKAEERSEASVVVDEGSWEERHVACWFENSLSCLCNR